MNSCGESVNAKRVTDWACFNVPDAVLDKVLDGYFASRIASNADRLSILHSLVSHATQLEVWYALLGRRIASCEAQLSE